MATVSTQVSVKAYAKINLALDVLGKRDDGYHEVRTVLQQVGLFDLVAVEAEWGAAQGDGAEFSMNMTGQESDLKEIPLDEGNIACQAAALFFRTAAQWMEAAAQGPGRHGRPGRPARRLDAARIIAGLSGGRARVSIEKRVPPGAGLGGGSADAAATLLGLSACFGFKSKYWFEMLMEQAASLGADVPFAMMGQARLNPELGFASHRRAASCALGEGIGERLRAAPPFHGWVLIVKPPVAASTARVYGALGEHEAAGRPDIDGLLAGLAEGDGAKVAENMANALEAPAFREYPEILEVKRGLEGAQGAVKTMMSGSGSAVFALFEKEESCRRAAGALAGRLKGNRAFVAPLMV